MLARIRRRIPLREHGPWVVVAAVAAALLATPFALASGENRAVRGGVRNPSPSASKVYKRQTQLVARTPSYTLLLSNKGAHGGSAVLGCRGGTVAGDRACLRVSNSSTGRVFEFAARGTGPVGVIEAGDATAAPFTTNATGVATGLNADRVDSKSADEIVADAVAQTQSRFATVSAAGAIGASRGAATANNAGAADDGTYTVVFADDLSRCALAATESTVTAAGSVAVELQADNRTVSVLTRDDANAAADRPFHLTVTC